jgi:hypothetical protein
VRGLGEAGHAGRLVVAGLGVGDGDDGGLRAVAELGDEVPGGVGGGVVADDDAVEVLGVEVVEGAGDDVGFVLDRQHRPGPGHQ